jgi:glucosamine-6-phosphate deaminase
MKSFKKDHLTVHIFNDGLEVAAYAAEKAGTYLVEQLASQPEVRVMLATGNSQIRFLSQLQKNPRIDWQRLVLFHMDEYLGIAETHKSSFRFYMREKVERLVQPKKFHYIIGDAPEPIQECDRYEGLLREKPLDLICLGVGENGHLAFNDPPVANYDDKRWVKIVQLDEACKAQQVNEGHFPSLEAVPPYALTVTLPGLFSARRMICSCPEKRKAVAVKNALEGPIAPSCPASYLRKCSSAEILLDKDSASLLTPVE